MALIPSLEQLLVQGFALLLLWAAWSDIQSFTIPNRVPLAIALLYPAHVIASPVPVANWLHIEGGRITSLQVAFDARELAP